MLYRQGQCDHPPAQLTGTTQRCGLSFAEADDGAVFLGEVEFVARRGHSVED